MEWLGSSKLRTAASCSWTWYFSLSANVMFSFREPFVVGATEGYWEGAFTSFRRYTLRIDGFVSAQAPLSGGELVTEPLTFRGSQLEINLSTSAAGSLRIEIQNTAGEPINGFSLADCQEIFGDSIAQHVTWNKRRQPLHAFRQTCGGCCSS